MSLRSFRGKVVILAFNDSECTTVCPLTTSAMLDAKAMLGKAGSRVQLLGIDANPAATSLEDVWSYSELRGMLHAWHFLTGSLPQLKRVWKQYAVEAAIEQGQITHTPALFVIDPQGRKAKAYITQMSYSAIGQLGQLLTQEASSLLPGHPRVDSNTLLRSGAADRPRRRPSACRAPVAGLPGSAPGSPRACTCSSRRGIGDQRPGRSAGCPERLRGRGRPAGSAAVDRRRRGQRRAIVTHARRVPGQPSASLVVSGRDRPHRADCRRVRGARSAMVRAHLGDRADPLLPRGLHGGLAKPQRAVRYLRAALARAPKAAPSAVGSLARLPPLLAALHQQAAGCWDRSRRWSRGSARCVVIRS